MEGGRRGKREKTEGETERRRQREREQQEASQRAKPMASSQNVQTLKNSRQRAGRERRCQEWEEEEGRRGEARAGHA